MSEENDDTKITALRLEHELKLYQSRIGLQKVIAGTMVVGLAAAFFPFAQKYAEVRFQKEIETIKADAQIRIVDRQHEIQKQEIELRSTIEIAQQNEMQVAATREFLNSLALEGRSSDIETRIRLAEYFSFVAPEEERGRWVEFRHYLSKRHDELREQREELRRVELTENTNLIDKVLAREGIIVIDREITPTTGAGDRVNRIEAMQTEALQALLERDIDGAIERMGAAHREWHDFRTVWETLRLLRERRDELTPGTDAAWSTLYRDLAREMDMRGVPEAVRERLRSGG